MKGECSDLLQSSEVGTIVKLKYNQEMKYAVAAKT